MQSEELKPFGHTLLVNKPLEWTSFDVVNKIRYAAKRITGRKKIKVGHAGTLDPLATGLVIVCVGSHTKQINDYMGLPKQYIGTFLLGATTPSYDLETPIDQTFALPEKDEGLLQQCAESFLGEQEQMPPPFSAKKVDGKKAYELARKGKEVNLKPSSITIDRFDIEASNFPTISFLLDCSKGTYVRSLAYDFGRACESGAHLTALCRTRIGTFSLKEALSVDAAIEALEKAFRSHLERD